MAPCACNSQLPGRLKQEGTHTQAQRPSIRPVAVAQKGSAGPTGHRDRLSPTGQCSTFTWALRRMPKSRKKPNHTHSHWTLRCSPHPSAHLASQPSTGRGERAQKWRRHRAPRQSFEFYCHRAAQALTANLRRGYSRSFRCCFFVFRFSSCLLSRLSFYSTAPLPAALSWPRPLSQVAFAPLKLSFLMLLELSSLESAQSNSLSSEVLSPVLSL